MISITSPQSTPKRPLPPAKLRRRAPSLPAHPPPPYDDANGDADRALTSGIDASTGKLNPPLEDWTNEKSREELSGLLLAAGSMIHDRETELGLTSALCKNLYEANLSLKSKHDALLARIPTQLGQTVSPLPSPTRALSPLPPLPATPHYYSISRPSSPSATLSPSLGPSSPSPSVLSERSRKGHARRISVTPSDLSYLADQNAELMHKLEKLEEESAQADARGKRKLKKLEKEIGLLKEELEKTRERGAELEERVMKKVTGVDDKEEEQKRRRREERVRALRRKGADEDEDEDEKPVVDFAPAPELPKIRTTLPVTIPEESEAALADEASIPDIAIISSSGDISSLTASTSASTSASPLTATSSQAHHLDYAIIAQLLSKIHELEETNIQIATEQRATSERLQTAQREVDGIKRAYDCLGHDDDEIEVCVVPDDEGEGSSFDWPRDGEAASAFGSPLRSAHASTGHTIRFSSLRRTIDGDASRLTVDDPKDDFASGVMRQSTTRSMLLLDNGEGGVRTKGKETKQKGGIQKTRKTVVGLFDNPAEGSSEARECTDDYFASLHASPSFRTLSPMPISPVSATPDMGDISGWSNAATDNELSCSFDSSSSQSGESDYASPIPSTAGFLTSESRSPSPSPSQLLSQFPSPAPSPSMLNVGGLALHTLGSELGSEFGDDWGERAGNHHLRATSLCEMNGDVSMESTGSVPGGWVLDGTEDDALYGSGRSRSLTIDVEHEDDHARTSSGASTAIARSVSGASASGSTSPSGTAAGTPTRANFPFHDGLHPQVVVQPPTPSANKYRIPAKSLRSRNITPIPSSKSMPGDGSGYGVSTLEKERLEKMNSRNARLSQTVRARTNRWVERRYAEYAVPSLSPVTSPTLPSVPFPSAQDTFSGGSLRRRTMQFPLKTGHAMVVSRRRRTASTAKEKMDESFEDAVHRVSRSISFSASGSQSGVDFAKLQEMELNFACSDAEPEGDSPRGQQNFVMQAARRDAAGADRLFAKKGGFVGFVLEVWLWLQFAIVVVVFLWAMARKGPKNVLEDAERSQRQLQRAR